jgi:hypothetical protein
VDRATVRSRAPLPSGERRTLPLATVARVRVRRDVALARIVRPPLAETARHTTCRLELPEGSVDVLLQQRGRRIHLVAVSERAAGARLSAALARARAALLAQGVRLHIDSRAKGLT